MPEKPINPPAPPAPVPAEDDQPVVPRRRECGTMPVHRRLLSTSLAYVRARASSENRHAEFKRSRSMGAAQQRTGVTRIPVVVHVVHHTAAQNVSDAQIKSQIDVLNKDFRKTNADIGSVPGVFSPVGEGAMDLAEVFAHYSLGGVEYGHTEHNAACQSLGNLAELRY